MNDKIVMSAIKPFIPYVKNKIKEMEPNIIGYIGSHPLEEGETEIQVITQIKDNRLWLVTSAFKGPTCSRFIEAKPLTDLFDLLLKHL